MRFRPPAIPEAGRGGLHSSKDLCWLCEWKPRHRALFACSDVFLHPRSIETQKQNSIYGYPLRLSGDLIRDAKGFRKAAAVPRIPNPDNAKPPRTTPIINMESPKEWECKSLSSFLIILDLGAVFNYNGAQRCHTRESKNPIDLLTTYIHDTNLNETRIFTMPRELQGPDDGRTCILIATKLVYSLWNCRRKRESSVL